MVAEGVVRQRVLNCRRRGEMRVDTKRECRKGEESGGREEKKNFSDFGRE